MLLEPGAELPRRPAWIAIAGSSGAGKSTLAVRLAPSLGIPYVELDSLFHGPGWTPRTAFVAEVEALTARPSWVVEWQYDAARPLLTARIDLLVWLDLPRRTVLRQVVVRTLRRRLHHEVLWNGNVEPPLRTVFTDHEHIVRWAWTHHHETATRVAAALAERPDLVVVRLRRRRDVERWLAGPLSRV